jgi:iodotyrosine deiodinase
MDESPQFLPLNFKSRYTTEQLGTQSEMLKEEYLSRRSCRFFKDEEVPESVIRNILEIGASAPSGANKQPWHFVAISKQEIKDKIKSAAEEEERLFYEERATEEWLADLAPLGTDWQKPFLSTAPWLIVVFKEIYGMDETGAKNKHYYVNESVGIAAGFLISAINNLGLATLTHTPSPMKFLSEILNRPSHQKPFLLLPVGYPTKDALVPNISKKEIAEHSSIIR